MSDITDNEKEDIEISDEVSSAVRAMLKNLKK